MGSDSESETAGGWHRQGAGLATPELAISARWRRKKNRYRSESYSESDCREKTSARGRETGRTFDVVLNTAGLMDACGGVGAGSESEELKARSGSVSRTRRAAIDNSN